MRRSLSDELPTDTEPIRAKRGLDTSTIWRWGAAAPVGARVPEGEPKLGVRKHGILCRNWHQVLSPSSAASGVRLRGWATRSTFSSSAHIDHRNGVDEGESGGRMPLVAVRKAEADVARLQRVLRILDLVPGADRNYLGPEVEASQFPLRAASRFLWRRVTGRGAQCVTVPDLFTSQGVGQANATVRSFHLPVRWAGWHIARLGSRPGNGALAWLSRPGTASRRRRKLSLRRAFPLPPFPASFVASIARSVGKEIFNPFEPQANSGPNYERIQGLPATGSGPATRD